MELKKFNFQEIYPYVKDYNNFSLNDVYFFYAPPKEIGKILKADSTLLESRAKKLKIKRSFYTSYVGKKGVAVYEIDKSLKLKEYIFLYSDENFLENIYNRFHKIDALKDFLKVAIKAYLNCQKKLKEKNILLNKEAIYEFEISKSTLTLIFHKNYFKIKYNGKLISEDELLWIDEYPSYFEIAFKEANNYIKLFKDDILEVDEFSQFLKFYFKYYKRSPKNQALYNKEILVKKENQKKFKRVFLISLVSYISIFLIFIYFKTSFENNTNSTYEFFKSYFGNFYIALFLMIFWSIIYTFTKYIDKINNYIFSFLVGSIILMISAFIAANLYERVLYHKKTTLYFLSQTPQNILFNDKNITVRDGLKIELGKSKWSLNKKEYNLDGTVIINLNKDKKCIYYYGIFAVPKLYFETVLPTDKGKVVKKTVFQLSPLADVVINPFHISEKTTEHLIYNVEAIKCN